jgi:tellurite resistance protein TerC
VHVPEISSLLSLGVIAVTLVLTAAASLAKDRSDRTPDPA